MLRLSKAGYPDAEIACRLGTAAGYIREKRRRLKIQKPKRRPTPCANLKSSPASTAECKSRSLHGVRDARPHSTEAVQLVGGRS